MAEVTLRDVTPDDVPLILDFTRELAVFERGTVTATPDHIRARFFGPHAIAYGVIAEIDGAPVGSAIYYFSFSSYTGQAILCLEDLIVRGECRGRGVGKKLLVELSARAVASDCFRVQWSALNWNENAHAVYKKLGATVSSANTYFHLGGEAMNALAAIADDRAGKQDG